MRASKGGASLAPRVATNASSPLPAGSPPIEQCRKGFVIVGFRYTDSPLWTPFLDNQNDFMEVKNMSTVEQLQQIEQGATEVEMFNQAKNASTANAIGTLLETGQPEQAYSLFRTTVHANKTVSNIKRANNL